MYATQGCHNSNIQCKIPLIDLLIVILTFYSFLTCFFASLFNFLLLNAILRFANHLQMHGLLYFNIFCLFEATRMSSSQPLLLFFRLALLMGKKCELKPAAKKRDRNEIPLRASLQTDRSLLFVVC